MESSAKINTHRLIPNILDQLAQDEPDKIYAELPISATDYSAGFKHITFSVLANAVNGVAWWLTEILGPGKDFPTLAYIGPNDLSHNILILGAVKAGYKMLLTSPIYGVEAHAMLMEVTECNVIFTSSVITPMSQLVKKISEESGNAKLFQLPDMCFFLSGKHQHFPYTKSFEEASNEPLVMLHTSGTTGFPRPIIWTHAWAAAFITQRYYDPPEGYENLDSYVLGTRLLSLMPPFHASHLFVGILFAIFCDNVSIMPPALAPTSIEVAIAGSQHTQVDAIALSPPFIDQLAARPELLDILLKNGVKTIIWGGGPATKESAEKVVSSINLVNIAGSTETGMWPTIRKTGPWDIAACRDLCFHPRANIVFREQTEGVFSAVIVKNAADVQPAFHVFQDATEVDSGDLWTRNPELGKEHLWGYYGRSDDIQVFHNALKWHPIVAENMIVSENSDIIQTALCDGTNRSHVVLLLDVVPSLSTKMAAMSDSEKKKKEEEIVDLIWPTVTKINLVTPSWVKIDRRMIVFVEAARPVARTPKGSVRRHQTIAIYEPYIQKVLQFANVEAAADFEV